MEDGLDPMSVTRDARPNKNVPTNAWNTIRLTTVASVFQASEA